MVIQVYPPYKLIPLSISGKLTLPQEILEASSDSPLFFRREKDAMQASTQFKWLLISTSIF